MATPTPLANIQGVPAGGAQVDSDNFFKYTKRQRGLMSAQIGAFAGIGEQDFMSMKQTGILAALDIRFVGSVTITPGSGTVASTYKWPYSFLKALQLTGNGQTNLINVNGQFLKARELVANASLNDRGVPKTIAGSTVYQGTYSLNQESWGVGQASTGLTSGTYDLDLCWRVPVAWDMLRLSGSLFLQTSATSVDVTYAWAPLSDLFTLTGNAAVTFAGSVLAEGVVFNIPLVGGTPVVPDGLQVFHSFTQNQTTDIGETTNQTVLAGQGNNKKLMRVFGQIWTGATGPGVPLGMSSADQGQIGWGYGLNNTPEIYQDGLSMAVDLERAYSSDLAAYQGMFVLDFARHWAARDSIDESQASQIFVQTTPLISLTVPQMQYAQEIIISAASGS